MNQASPAVPGLESRQARPAGAHISLVFGVAAFALLPAFGFERAAHAQPFALGTAFTYQGSLTDGASPANGAFDFEFALFDDDDAGSAVGSVQTKDDVAVTQGVFTISLDFGAGAFAGERRRLQIGVRPGADAGAYTTLAPRVELSAAPHALYAVSAGTAADATMLGGQSSSSYATQTDLANLDLGDVLATGTDADALEAVNLGKVAIGTDTATDELTLAGGAFTQSSSAPVHVGKIADSATTRLDGARDVAIQGDYAYVASANDAGMEVLDVSDPTNPVHVGSIADDGTTLMSAARGVAVAGRYAYVAASFDHGLEILDISDPANPVHAGSIADDGTRSMASLQDVVVVGGLAFVVGSEGLAILDVSDPGAPAHAGSLALGFSFGIAVAGDHAYVGHPSSLSIVDVSEPTAPVVVGSLADDDATALLEATGIAVSGGYAYVCGTSDSGVSVVDVSNPAAPVHVGAIFDDDSRALAGPYGIVVAGRYALVGTITDNAVAVLDVSNPAAPTYVGAIADDPTTLLDTPRGMAIRGRHLFVTSQVDDGVEVLRLPGIDVPSGVIGAAFADSLVVSQTARFDQRIEVGDGIVAGAGARIGGDVSVGGDLTVQGALNASVDWNDLVNVPAGFADGVDNEGTIVLLTAEALEATSAGEVSVAEAENLASRLVAPAPDATAPGATDTDASGETAVVGHDAEGRPRSISYERLAGLQSRPLKKQREEIEDLRERLTRLEAAFEAVRSRPVP